MNHLYALDMAQCRGQARSCRRRSTSRRRPGRLWERLYNGHVGESSTDFPECWSAPRCKLVAYSARLALIFHLLRSACGEAVGDDVDDESLDRSLRLIAYFKSHARVVYARLALGARPTSYSAPGRRLDPRPRRHSATRPTSPRTTSPG